MSESSFAVLSDEQWEQIQPCLPSSDGRRGRPFRDSHQIVEGIVYRYRTGIPWRDLPRERFGPWQTVWKRRRYGAREPAGHDIGRSRGGLTTKIHAVVDGNGRPLAAVVTGGQRNDGAMLIEVLAEIRVPRLGPGRPRTRPDAVLADRAYTSRINRGHLARRGITGVIPQKRDEIAARQRRGSRGGRPPGFDAVAYKGRNVVERSFALAKQWRGLATRYDRFSELAPAR